MNSGVSTFPQRAARLASEYDNKLNLENRDSSELAAGSLNAVNYFQICVLILITVFGLTGCAKKDNAPVIRNLVYEKKTLPLQDGATGNIIGTFNIDRVTGETASVNTVVYDAQGKKISTNSIPMTDDLRKESALGFGVEMNLSKKANYTFDIFIVDSQGRQSNALTGSFSVTDIY